MVYEQLAQLTSQNVFIHGSLQRGKNINLNPSQHFYFWKERYSRTLSITIEQTPIQCYLCGAEAKQIEAIFCTKAEIAGHATAVCSIVNRADVNLPAYNWGVDKNPFFIVSHVNKRWKWERKRERERQEGGKRAV